MKDKLNKNKIEKRNKNNMIEFMQELKKIINNIVIKEDYMIFKECLIEKVFKQVLMIYLYRNIKIIIICHQVGIIIVIELKHNLI
jgi:hypothetical protein